MDPELKQLEEELRGFAPSPVSGEVLSRMVEAMEQWEEVEEVEEVKSSEPKAADLMESGKVISFPSEKINRGASWRPMWVAAASVALMGAVLGLVLPQNDVGGVTAMSGLGPVPVLRQAGLVPVNVQRKLKSMDTGVVSNKDGLQFQCIRVVRQDVADFRGQDGEENVGLKITRPKVDYYVVPVSY